MNRIPSLNWLRAFEAAARTGSFAGAARLLNVSATAASKQIRALEEYLGSPLFIRHAHSVEITKAGRDFLPTVQQSLFAIEATASAMFGEHAGGGVTLSLPHIVACSWLAERLPRFLAANRGVRVQLFTEATSAPLAQASGFSIRFGGSPGAVGDHDRLFGETVYPVASAEIAASIGRAEDLLHWPLIGVGAHRVGWLEFLAQNGVAPRRRVDVTFVDSTAVALLMADSGGAIALARAPATDALVARLGLVRCAVPLELATHDAYFLVYPSRRSLGRSAVLFRGWLLDEALTRGATATKRG